MGYTALYREWRPKNFEDIVGQEHITTTLKNEIINNRIAHAYLLCGTRGTGKTSTAKVLAKALNCLNLKDGEPCNECENCKKIDSGLAIDVTELDAASNNGIDKIRDIIDDTKYPPQEGKYKVYIMDEVHMLSVGAVNAFLKTLEEPPANVIFILATTDPQKLPITILSRCQRFDFKRIKQKDITSRLRKITDVKGVKCEEKSLDLISRVCDGALRDALSILDQAIAMGDNEIKYEDLVSILGLVTDKYLFDLTNSVLNRDIEKCIKTIDDIVYEGKDIQLFIKDLIAHFRNLLMVKVTNNPEEVLDMPIESIVSVKEQGRKIRVEEIMRAIRILQEADNNAKISKQARTYLELAIIKMCKIEYDTSNEVILGRINRIEEQIKSGDIKVTLKEASNAIGNKVVAPKNNDVVVSNNNKPREEDKKADEVDGNNTDFKTTIEDVERKWTEILESLGARRAMVVKASLLTGKPNSIKNGVLTIEFPELYSKTKERLEKEEYKIILEEVLKSVFKENIKTRFIVIEEKVELNKEDILKNKLGNDVPFEVYDE